MAAGQEVYFTVITQIIMNISSEILCMYAKCTGTTKSRHAFKTLLQSLVGFDTFSFPVRRLGQTFTELDKGTSIKKA